MKLKFITAIAMFIMAASPGLTACSQEDGPLETKQERPVAGNPTPEPGKPGDDNDNEDDANDNNDETMSRNITIKVGQNSFSATLEDNDAARAFSAMLPITVNMNEMNGNEKYFYLPQNLPTNTYRPGTIRNGDLLLYGSSCVVIFYQTFASQYSYTRLGKIENPDRLAAALGSGNITVTFKTNN